MTKKFDPDKPFVKVRGMNGIHYEQAGHKFNSGHIHLGSLKNGGKKVEPKPVDKKDVRARARAKIEKKKGKGSLKGFREDDTPGPIKSAMKENETARQAEERE